MEYSFGQLAANNRRRRDLYTLSSADQKLLEELGWKEKLSKIDQAILSNKEFVLKMVDDPRIFANANLGDEEDSEMAGSGQEQNDESNAYDQGRCAYILLNLLDVWYTLLYRQFSFAFWTKPPWPFAWHPRCTFTLAFSWPWPSAFSRSSSHDSSEKI